ncbi:hypothetical protein GWI33_007666 [Rhynchophorus ferrugineus]|uniref:Uncharacterized protein n=1 Tax=Rhynchophorus ferrugineus TaxID=354439 RepID=A0A834MBT2_RHYFE|nr:hypothetical protein GWI33_007666 [Rhynchophorus ferrugineus]
MIVLQDAQVLSLTTRPISRLPISTVSFPFFAVGLRTAITIVRSFDIFPDRENNGEAEKSESPYPSALTPTPP